jgi:transposase
MPATTLASASAKSAVNTKSEPAPAALRGDEPKLSVENRLTIAACLLGGREPKRGEVQRLADRFGVSRKTIREWRDRMAGALFREAGRPPKSELQRRSETLEHENQRLREELESTERRLAEYEAASGGKR